MTIITFHDYVKCLCSVLAQCQSNLFIFNNNNNNKSSKNEIADIKSLESYKLNL